ncbi:AMP-dependent synthetase/ligase domain - like 10 [Theobroma cacao]|nr:AMP-dependent synthetase/ligase domain - like 10 [Theobroma cacao]
MEVTFFEKESRNGCQRLPGPSTVRKPQALEKGNQSWPHQLCKMTSLLTSSGLNEFHYAVINGKCAGWTKVNHSQLVRGTLLQVEYQMKIKLHVSGLTNVKQQNKQPGREKHGHSYTIRITEARRQRIPSPASLSISGKFDITHSRLQELVEHAASRLVTAGFGRGDVVALALPNTIEFVTMFLAITRARATAAPLSPAYTTEEFEFYVSDSESKLLLTPQNGNTSAQAAASNLTYSSMTRLTWHSSSTLLAPQGVPLTQLNIVSSVKNTISVYKLTESDSSLLVPPLFHVHGLLTGLLSPLGAGGAVAIPAAGRFSASTFWQDVKQDTATWYTAVPTIHQILLERHVANPDFVYPKLRFIRSCSASLALAILERLEEAFGAPVLEAYAMSEATRLTATNPLVEDGRHKSGSVGKPVGQEVVILDENGVPQEANVRGEMCIGGPNVTKGYKNNPEANKAGFEYGWFHTGDLGYFDSDGYLYLVGRIKEFINRGDIAQAVASGVPDDKYGEEINCTIVPREGWSIGEAELQEFCRKNLAAFKVPKKVFITDSLPKTASGKIHRRFIAQHFLARISTSESQNFLA